MSSNSNYPVVAGDTWRFNDSNIENRWTKWKILSVDKETGLVEMVKLDGMEPGFRTPKYQLDWIVSPKWEWVEGQAKPDVLFPCPECNEDKPIVEGDFICQDCRGKLESP